MTGYLLLAASAFTAQALMFVPIVPLLVATGALASRGEITAPWSAVALTAGVAAGDLLWYGIGRRRGRAVMGRLCRVALEPSTRWIESCAASCPRPDFRRTAERERQTRTAVRPTGM